MPGRSARHRSKSLRAAWASRALSRGPGRGALARGAGRGGSGLLRPRAGREGQPVAPGAWAGCRGGGGGRGKSPPRSLEPAARALPGSPPFPVAPRGCPGRGVARALLARHAGPREEVAGSGRSGSRATGGGEINNARKRKTDVSLARASPASRPGCAPARAPRCRRQSRCSDSSSPSSEAIVYWALNNLFIHPRGKGLPAPGVLLGLPPGSSDAAGGLKD